MKYRTKADGENSNKPYRPQVGLWDTSVKITPEVAAELRRLADEGLNGTLYLSPNRFKKEGDNKPTHQLTIFTAEERLENMKKYATTSDATSPDDTF